MNPEIPPTIPTQSPVETTPDPYLQAGQPSSGGSGKIWMILTIVFGLLLIALGVFTYIRIGDLNKQISSQSAQINTLNSQVSELQAKNTELTEAAAKAATATTTKTDDELTVAVAQTDCQAQVVTTSAKPFTFTMSTIGSSNKKVIYASNNTLAKLKATCTDGYLGHRNAFNYCI